MSQAQAADVVLLVSALDELDVVWCIAERFDLAVPAPFDAAADDHG